MHNDLYEIAFSPALLPQRMAEGLSVGDHAEFALEFYAPQPLRLVQNLATAAEPGLRRVGRARFEIAARVVHLRPHWWVLDAGIRLFRAEAPPKLIREGSEVTGTCSIGVGTYFYEENLSKEADSPPLIYKWFVDRIKKDETPVIRVGRGRLERDKARERRTEVAQTEPWMDVPDNQDCVLHCRHLGSAPTRAV
jgi:hypothetical protein